MIRSLKTVLFLALIFAILVSLNLSLFANKELVTLNVTSSGTPAHLECVKKVAKMYMDKNPNVNIKIYTLPQEPNEKYSLYLQTFEAKSSDLDVLCIDGIWPGDLAGNLLDLNKYGAKKITETMFPSMVEGGTVNGKLVSMPWYASCPALYYRKDLLDKYDLKVPETWKDLMLAAVKIQKGERDSGNPDFVGYVWEGEAFEGLTCVALEWLYSNGGGTIVSLDKKITVDNQNAVKALNMAKSWIGTISPNGVTSMDGEGVRNVFQGGNAAFMRNWQYAYVLCQGKDSPVKGKIGITLMPQGSAGISANTAGTEYLGVNKYSKNPKIAADFVFFMNSPKAQKLKALTSGHCPTIKSLYNDKELIKENDAFPIFEKILKHTVNRPAIQTAPHYNQVSKIFFQAVYSVLNGSNSAQSALSTAAKNISEVTKYPIVK